MQGWVPTLLELALSHFLCTPELARQGPGLVPYSLRMLWMGKRHGDVSHEHAEAGMSGDVFEREMRLAS